MFYGSGAGKLPTASAVVGDIVDAARHLKTGTIRNGWSGEPAHMMSLDHVTGEFLVRIKAEAREQAEAVFETKTILQLPNHPEEMALLTGEMSQGEYREKASQLKEEILGMIRIKD